MTAELLFDCRHHLAEGPVWHDNALYWVNITAGELHRLDPATGDHSSRTIGGLLGCAVPATDGRWLLGRNGGFDLYDWNTGELDSLAQPEGHIPRNRFNDGKCDYTGRLFAGTINLDLIEGSASLYRLDSNLAPVTVLQGVTISNGLAWSADSRTLYYTDTLTRRIDRFDFDPDTGNISNRRPLSLVPENGGYPDGMDIDTDGNLWVALWGASSVVCYHGQTGAELHRIHVPVSQPSSCAFGGPGLDNLYITTARQDLSESVLAAEPTAGSIYQIKLPVKGRAAASFALH